jgi:hypothetical protein
MFFKDFTPLLGSPNQIRAGRIYPGGKNLDCLIGKKTNPESGWYYPEAWIFSPNPAINLGSERSTEGETLIYDNEGKIYSWREYIKLNPEVLGNKKLALCIKLLDSDCTLPKEFHFRNEDTKLLKQYSLLKNFKGTIIKPEIWIKHPSVEGITSPAYIGFNKKLSQESFFQVVTQGVEAMEEHMNSVSLEKGEALYVPGGIVHSLGRGLYFEVLCDGDLKITLQNEFAGRKLSIKEQLDKIYTSKEDNLFDALRFIDYSQYGQDIINKYLKKSQGEEVQNIIKNDYFSADWIRVKPKEKLTLQSKIPHILVTASGCGIITSENSELLLQTKATTIEEFKENSTCYALVVHDSTKQYSIENKGKFELVLLKAY